MSKVTTKAIQPKAKATERKEFNAESYERPGLSREEVKDIKQAFDIFDTHATGLVNPKDLVEAFEDLSAFKNRPQSKFIYAVLGELTEEYPNGINFDDFLKVATSKISDKDSRQQVHKVFKMFDEGQTGKVTVTELEHMA